MYRHRCPEWLHPIQLNSKIISFYSKKLDTKTISLLNYLRMKMTLRLFLISLLTCGFALTGCVKTIDGRKKMANPMVKDKIVSTYATPVTPEILFQSAKKVLGEMGNLYGENTINSTLEAKIDTRTVWVKVEKGEGDNVNITTQVRAKGGGTDISLASEVDKRIALDLQVSLNK